MNKNFLNFQNFQSFFFTSNSSYISRTTPFMQLIFLLKMLHCICQILAKTRHLYRFKFCNCNILKMKNLNAHSTAAAMFWIGKPRYMSVTCVAPTYVMKEYYRDETLCTVLFLIYLLHYLSISLNFLTNSDSFQIL